MKNKKDITIRSSVAEYLTFCDNELEEGATIRNFRIVQTEGVRQVSREVKHYNLQKYRVVQNQIYVSDFDRFMMLEKKTKKRRNDYYIYTRI